MRLKACMDLRHGFQMPDMLLALLTSAHHARCQSGVGFCVSKQGPGILPKHH